MSWQIAGSNALQGFEPETKTRREGEARSAALESRMTDGMQTPEFAPPDADRAYRNYLETCQRLGIEPVLRGHARELMSEWNEVLSGRGTPTTH